ncbi:hypothetical protein U1763_09075 [Sphingomonas sp. LB2R24]|uniref:hypothetical protein n=1 Tax=Sphingomonas TaxID=13687 RepID=UPI001053A05F|nr:hypothetical protein [Sphingomonas sp. PP-F2F-A104-K0414]
MFANVGSVAMALRSIALLAEEGIVEFAQAGVDLQPGPSGLYRTPLMSFYCHDIASAAAAGARWSGLATTSVLRTSF